MATKMEKKPMALGMIAALLEGHHLLRPMQSDEIVRASTFLDLNSDAVARVTVIDASEEKLVVEIIVRRDTAEFGNKGVDLYGPEARYLIALTATYE